MAAYHLWGPGDLFDPFFTLESAPLDGGQKELLDQIGVTDLPPVTSNGVTLTPLAAVADEHPLYLRLRLEAPAVIFAGMVPPEEVPEWYRLGDLFVSASSSETQGLTYIEALAAGVPALCRADLCLEGVILEGENGWQYHSTVEFRQRLEEFLASPETHEALKRRAAESAEQFSAQRFAQRVERIYQMQLARRAASCVQGVTA